MDRDVVVTGIGMVTPLGMTADRTWEEVCAGTTAAGPITRFDPDEAAVRSRIACEINDSLAERTGNDWIDDRTMGRYTQFAVTAAAEAIADAEFDPDTPSWRPSRVATSIASTFGGLSEIEAASGQRPSPRFLITALANLAAGHVSMCFDAQGPNRSPGTACAAGTHAIADAAADIRTGRADVAIAGGTEAPITPLGVAGFDAMRALSTRNDEPERASRPFDADRDGFVLAEGCAILVLEERSRAAERGVTPYAAITGSGLTADAHHPTRPAEGGQGLQRSLERALEDAALDPDAVDHVNTHGTSTPTGDAREAEALQSVFDTVPPVTSVKGALGHTLSGAGALESAIVALTIAEQTIPPTVNYETPDPACDLSPVTDTCETSIDAAVTTSAGFGGTNGALVFERS
ncbi:beta-ketoacyl-[acyl-carrier-protein] synthase family protein [Haloterrigena sp. SYSU A121-1]|uniref:Beta-ketoacyl-[acyl-carrier-protein] synthase family protein n=1 Tax=Haloterrigena gelatinilytica TaxID=2741724 RepID=A0A8J8GPY0_9EURY|nr:beta-ketoacyl-[acyl-carrier-protein] synthase family protein [Haloterrigena gelatinilytica]NUB93841.1 beta-ketoacyl-[acyl-carrier-protein] synthase family protein [Haloterrigena gelatinilytica]